MRHSVGRAVQLAYSSCFQRALVAAYPHAIWDAIAHPRIAPKEIKTSYGLTAGVQLLCSPKTAKGAMKLAEVQVHAKITLAPNATNGGKARYSCFWEGPLTCPGRHLRRRARLLLIFLVNSNLISMSVPQRTVVALLRHISNIRRSTPVRSRSPCTYDTASWHATWSNISAMLTCAVSSTVGLAPMCSPLAQANDTQIGSTYPGRAVF